MSSDEKANSGTAVPQSRDVNLLLAAPRFYPVYAGPAVRFQRYAPGLAKRGVKMRVISGAWDGTDSEASQEERDACRNGLLPLADVHGIPVQRVSIPERRTTGARQAFFDRALARYVVRNPIRPDVVQLLALSSPSLPSLVRLRMAGIPLVYTFTMMRDPSVAWIKNRYWLLPFRLMNCIVVSSGVMKAHLREFGIRSRVEVIPNGLDLERFRPVRSSEERAAIRIALGFDPKAELIVFLGGYLEHRKGVDVLLDAWYRIARKRPHARLVVVGPRLNKLGARQRQKKYVRDLLQTLKQSGTEDRVTFTGAVQDVERYLQAADVFVFPSRREGMPNVVPEAFGCGVPSILAPFIGLPAEFGRPGKEFDLAERTPDAFAAAINRMLDDPARRRQFGERAREWVERELGLDASLDRYAALYRELAKRHRQGGSTE